MFGGEILLEGTFEGQHTEMVQYGLSMGMILFITSEVMFFLLSFGLFSILVLLLL